MKVFISWSGERSQILARALHEWLPLVLHYVQPWLSEADVSAGDRWAQEVAKGLETSNFGIICVTPENLASPWVLFEAGALAKSMQGAKVIPLLFGLEFSDITGPLAQFQAKKIEKVGLGEVIQAINHATDHSVPDDRAKQLFSALWPDLEKKIEAIPNVAPSERHMRPQHEIIEELVAGVRGLDSRFREFEGSIGERISRPGRRFRRFHPMMLEDMSHMISDEGDDPLALLMIASFAREDFPWLYELVSELYREIRIGDAKAIQRAGQRLRRATKMLRRGPFMDLMMDGSKESHFMAMELPHMLERFIHRYDGAKIEGLPEESDNDQKGEG